MNRYRYVKAPPRLITSGIGGSKFQNHYGLLGKIFFFIGFIILASVIWPIASFELFTSPQLKNQNFLSPIPSSEPWQILGISNDHQDLNHPQNWFVKAAFPQKRESKITHYTLSIPTLDIENAVVEIAGSDLSQVLIHYPGTALPGEVGAGVIFGHSVLPQFFNPDNYISIFSLIPQMEIGDKIIIKFDGITYQYRVIDKVEVKPTNLSVLDQPFDNEYLRLVTCTPPGTYLRRGVITATLIHD